MPGRSVFAQPRAILAQAILAVQRHARARGPSPPPLAPSYWGSARSSGGMSAANFSLPTSPALTSSPTHEEDEEDAASGYGYPFRLSVRNTFIEASMRQPSPDGFLEQRLVRSAPASRACSDGGGGFGADGWDHGGSSSDEESEDLEASELDEEEPTGSEGGGPPDCGAAATPADALAPWRVAAASRLNAAAPPWVPEAREASQEARQRERRGRGQEVQRPYSGTRPWLERAGPPPRGGEAARKLRNAPARGIRAFRQGCADEAQAAPARQRFPRAPCWRKGVGLELRRKLRSSKGPGPSGFACRAIAFLRVPAFSLDFFSTHATLAAIGAPPPGAWAPPAAAAAPPPQQLSSGGSRAPLGGAAAADLQSAAGAQRAPPGALPSRGSAGHSTGFCKPCAFYATKGCGNGAQCKFCHLCDAGEKKRRRKDTRSSSSAGRCGSGGGLLARLPGRGDGQVPAVARGPPSTGAHARYPRRRVSSLTVTVE
ncbi:unnamed protein product [Prorocentrum cordatum]|uniref:C3H1-type domain-containing protein n=1 Tax=Prorocentrum cordatum TaxID=2364126 RepID=A0ABN9UQC5_9DINO|nr:unnamed protein product [Polarella glacialis]